MNDDLKSENPLIDNQNLTGINNTTQKEYFRIESKFREENDNGEKALYLAKLCLNIHRYNDAMVYADEMVIKCRTRLTMDKIQLLLAAYSLSMSHYRDACKRITQREKSDLDVKRMMQEIKKKKEEHIARTCHRIITLINTYILNKDCSDEEKALLFKVKADHYRYLAEITKDNAMFTNKQNALYYYKEAHEIAQGFNDLNQTKLNIALNFSVFLFETLNKRLNAFFFAKEALFKALTGLKSCSETELTEDSMRNTLMIIEILSVNIEEWYKEEIAISNKVFLIKDNNDTIEKETISTQNQYSNESNGYFDVRDNKEIY